VRALARISDLLERAQIDPSLAREDAIAAIVDERRREVGGGLDEYAVRLERDPDELERLRERIAVPETWLFRYPAAFELLRARLAGRRTFRALSVACATGAEPFSIAAAAIAAGVPASDVTVDAVDPNPRALEQAAAGRLGRMAVRGGLPPWAAGMFRADDGGVTVDGAVRACVRLHRGSAPEALEPFAAGSFDAVFCRNLAIYLSIDARAAIGRGLDRVLAADGLLLVGHAERPAAFGLGDRYEPACDQSEGAFAWVRARPADPPAACRTATAAPRRAPAAHVPRPAAPRQRPPAPPAPTLEAARAAADAGRLAEARDAALALHAAGDRSTGLFHLLGTVEAALGRPSEAEGWLRQAVYLDPSHGEALVQLALLADARGDRGLAARYRARASGAGG
jgi:chemotaxis protein methyltransferase WspC